MEVLSVVLIIINLLLLVFVWLQLKDRTEKPMQEGLSRITQELSRYLIDYQDRQKQYQSEEFNQL